MDNKKLSDEELIRGCGGKLGFYLANMNISDDAKELFMEILSRLPIERVVKIASIFEEKFASEQLELLNIDFENKLEQLAIEYADKEKQIDDKTIEEIEGIFNKQ